MEPKTLGERILYAREAVGYSLAELAEAAGLAVSGVRHLEGDKVKPTTGTLEALATALGVKPGWLAFGEGERPGALELRAAARDRASSSSPSADLRGAA